ncbi:MAG TPA: AraC family transcriptional regulator ligand-binding domain-containing protein [Solimonas sp.]|nr:AraC family transcriptional regulator ligand-binding domain-containing protein [Solimonas sp.]
MTLPAIATVYVLLLYQHLREQGLDPEAVLGEPEPKGQDLGVARWEGDRWLAALQRGAAATGEAAFGLRVASRVNARNLGLLGYLLLSCGNVMEALQRAQRYHALITDIEPPESRMEGPRMILRWPVAGRWKGQLWDEVMLGTAMLFMRDLTGVAWNAQRADFVGPAPADLQPYTDFFGGEVCFDQPAPRLVFPISVLSLPLRAPDAGLLAMLDAQADRLLQEIAPGSPELRQLRQQLVQLMRKQPPTLGALATKCHTSPRSLQRHLAAHGLSFQELLDDVRRGLSADYLRDPRLELKEVSALLGFADQSTFTRAFTAWYGCAPGLWRRQMLKPSS